MEKEIKIQFVVVAFLITLFTLNLEGQFYGDRQSNILVSVDNKLVELQKYPDTIILTVQSRDLVLIKSIAFNKDIYYKEQGYLEDEKYRFLFKVNNFCIDQMGFNYHGVLEHYEIDGSELNGNYYRYGKNSKMDQDGFYKNGMRDSLWRSFHPDGSVSSVGNYIPNKFKITRDSSFVDIFYIKDKRDTIGLYDEDKFYEILDSFNLRKVQDSVIFTPFIYHYKQGEWNYFSRNGGVIRKELYNKGVMSTSFDY